MEVFITYIYICVCVCKDYCRFRCMIINTEYVQFQSTVLVNPMHKYMCVCGRWEVRGEFVYNYEM